MGSITSVWHWNSIYFCNRTRSRLKEDQHPLLKLIPHFPLQFKVTPPGSYGTLLTIPVEELDVGLSPKPTSQESPTWEICYSLTGGSHLIMDIIFWELTTFDSKWGLAQWVSGKAVGLRNERSKVQDWAMAIVKKKKEKTFDRVQSALFSVGIHLKWECPWQAMPYLERTMFLLLKKKQKEQNWQTFPLEEDKCFSLFLTLQKRGMACLAKLMTPQILESGTCPGRFADMPIQEK